MSLCRGRPRGPGHSSGERLASHCSIPFCHSSGPGVVGGGAGGSGWAGAGSGGLVGIGTIQR